MTDTADEIKELKVRVYDLSQARAQLDQEIGQTNMKIAELTQGLNGQLPPPTTEEQS